MNFRGGAVLLVSALLITLVGGCATASGEQATTIDDVAEERATNAEARLDVLLEAHGRYLLSRWPELQLPEAGPAQWLDATAWPSAYSACLSVRTSVPVQPDGATGTVALGRATSDDETRQLELAIYTCEAMLPPPSIAAGEPGPLEIAWRQRVVEVDLPRCLLRRGVTLGVTLGGRDGDPYARVRGDPPALDRAQALCPDPLSQLENLPPAGRE